MKAGHRDIVVTTDEAGTELALSPRESQPAAKTYPCIESRNWCARELSGLEMG